MTKIEKAEMELDVLLENYPIIMTYLNMKSEYEILLEKEKDRGKKW